VFALCPFLHERRIQHARDPLASSVHPEDPPPFDNTCPQSVCSPAPRRASSDRRSPPFGAWGWHLRSL